MGLQYLVGNNAHSIRASDGTKKVGGAKRGSQKIATAIDDELPLKGIICKKVGGSWPPGPFVVGGPEHALTCLIDRRRQIGFQC